MSIEELLEALVANESQSCAACHKETKRSWCNSDGLEKKLRKIGKLEGATSYGWESYVEAGEKKHSDFSTVSLSHYPYNGGSAYRCDECDGIYIIYLETGGHGARYQARWIRSDLQFMP